MVALLHGGEERVEVDVEDRPLICHGVEPGGRARISATALANSAGRGAVGSAPGTGIPTVRLAGVSDSEDRQPSAATGPAENASAGDDSPDSEDDDLVLDGPSDRLPIIALILVLAFGLRFFNLEHNPPELFEDELSGFVSVHSLVTTGHDVERTVLPFLTTRLELKQPLYFVATVPFQAVLGETTLAARLPAVLFGLAGVLLILAVAVVLGLGWGAGLVAAGLYAITPWAVHYGRAGWEPAAFLPFVLGGIALLWVGLRDHRRGWTVGAAAVLAIGAYSYHPALLMDAVIAAVIILVRVRDLRRSDLVALAIGAAVAAIVLVPYAIAATDPLFLQRTRGISVFRHGLDADALLQIWRNYWAQWDPAFLLAGQATNPRINPGPLLFTWTVPFFLVGLDRLFHRRSLVDWFLLAWLVVGPLPGALTEDGTTPHAARGLVALPAILIVTALGAVHLFELAEAARRRWIRPALFAAVTAIAFAATALWSVDYFGAYPIRSASWWGYGAGNAFALAKARVEPGSTICIATNDISGFTFWHQVAYYLPDPDFRVVKGLGDAVCRTPGTYLLVLVSRELDRPVKQVATVPDIRGKAFYELDIVAGS
jgi:4-amino-4-deoxy-L-arabinose transferase-like glycosyltransferase